MSAFATGGRQRLQERSDEGARARCVEPFRWCGNARVFSARCGLPALHSLTLAAAPAARQFCGAGTDPVAGTSWLQN